MKRTKLLPLDGRELAYTDIGDPDGAPVFFFHGAPGSRLTLLADEPELTRRGLRVVSVDRPGYGRSSPQPGRTMSDWPTDVARLAESLGIDRFSVAGYSSGGPYSVACASLLPDRVAGAVVLAGVTDFAWPGAMERYKDTEVQLMRMPDLESVLNRCTELFGADGRGLLESPDIQLPPRDMSVLSNPVRGGALYTTIIEAFRQGVGGYAQDIFVQGHPWPFDPGSITAPAIVAHGDVDPVVPVDHARHTAELMPGSSLRILTGHGHLSIAAELPALLEELQTTA